MSQPQPPSRSRSSSRKHCDLRDLGEDRLIARLTRRLPTRPDLLVGPGDDCAVILPRPHPRRGGERHLTLLKTDATVQGVHFTPDTDLRRVGWKALARAVSDIAAMGGEPEHALVSLGLPPGITTDSLDALYTGLRKCARRFGIAIAGGETTRLPAPGDPLIITVALTGRVAPRECILRSGGRPGDLLYVTGRLGGSLAGKHLDFLPRLAESRWLVTHTRPTAMMDLSDGLGIDLPRLALASGCGFHLDTLPCTRGVTPQQALSDGEDFELLFALSPRLAKRLESTWPFPKLPLTRIGRLTQAKEFVTLHGTTLHGFDHFASSAGNL